MGHDRFLQGLPEHAPFLSVARSGDASRTWRVCAWHASSASALGPFDDDHTIAALERYRRTLDVAPRLPELYLDLGRRWDMLRHALCALHHGRQHRNEPGRIAINGNSDLAPGGTGGQGVPVRWNPPPAVAEVAFFLDGIDMQQFEQACDPHEMEAAGVYGARADDDRTPELVADLRGLRRLYLECASLEYGVLIFTY